MAAIKTAARKMSPAPAPLLSERSRSRAPRIGQLERQSTIVEEEDLYLCTYVQQQQQQQEQQQQHTKSKQTIKNEDVRDGRMGGKEDSVWDCNAENIKNAMVSRTSFISVIEETKSLSICDEKKRSPKHVPAAPIANQAHGVSPAASPGSALPLPSPSSSLPTPRLLSPSPSPSPALSPSSPSAGAASGGGPPPLPPRLQSGPPRVPPISPHTNASTDSNAPLVNNSGTVPVPAKCSNQLRKLIQSHSVAEEDQKVENGMRPIYPNLPYSPYSSPCSSPRVKRRPLVETRTVSTEQNGEFVQLNQYKLQGVVGQGSYGIVKLAYNEDDNTNYAMKILSKKKLKKKAGIFGRAAPNRKGSGGGKIKTAENPLDKVYREIAIMKKLDHPNVVKLVEVVDDPEDDQMYMVFELLERGEILEVPSASPLGETGTWTGFRDVLLGLEYLHYQKIIHRDIKPSNLLRADSGEVKIADLGVSNEFHGTDAFLTSTVGTPAFTPPESLSQQPGEPPYSGKTADIWSLGVTLYSLVFGKVPFHETNILALYNQIRFHDFKIPENFEISSELEDLLRKMLIKDPTKRISLAEIKEHDWVTCYGLYPMPAEEEHCELIEVTDKEVENSIRSIPKLDTLILVKAMLKQHSFSNPFTSIKDKFQRNGRSNSAPGEYSIYLDTSRRNGKRLPSLSEGEGEQEEQDGGPLSPNGDC